jgi:hypothetical protein
MLFLVKLIHGGVRDKSNGTGLRRRWLLEKASFTKRGTYFIDILTSANISLCGRRGRPAGYAGWVVSSRVSLSAVDFGLAIRLWNVLLHLMQVAGTPQKLFESRKARESLDSVCEGFRG